MTRERRRTPASPDRPSPLAPEGLEPGELEARPAGAAPDRDENEPQLAPPLEPQLEPARAPAAEEASEAAIDPANRPVGASRFARPAPAPAIAHERPGPLHAQHDGPLGPDGLDRGATAPQLRRFIKSRAYVPMHELRRRFGIDGGDDVVTPVELEAERVYVGLPSREGRLLADLLRQGDIGYELSLDPIAPIVVGVYPMRPVPRG